MADPHAELEDAILEVERVRRFLGRLKQRQIRAAEHRDLLKASALSWFQSHRKVVSPVLAPDVLQSIDRPYQVIIDACERHSAKSTYVDAVKEAKAALVAARRAVLTHGANVSSEDAAPNFAPLASDVVMRGILARRWNECHKCLEAGAPLAATVMMGGMLEALFVSRANNLADKRSLFSCRSTPKDPKTGKALELRQWLLATYIDIGHELSWISRSARDVAEILRDYRNYIHPEKERSHGVVLSQDDAAILWEVTKGLSRELLAMKGKT